MILFYSIVCDLNNCIYHARCLNITMDAAHEIASYDHSWSCFYCCAESLPLYSESMDLDCISLKCHCCFKVYTPVNEFTVTCIICKKQTHKKCTNDNVCKKCTSQDNNIKDTCDNIDIYKVHYNPLNSLFETNDSDSFNLNAECEELTDGMHCNFNTLECCKIVNI